MWFKNLPIFNLRPLSLRFKKLVFEGPLFNFDVTVSVTPIVLVSDSKLKTSWLLKFNFGN